MEMTDPVALRQEELKPLDLHPRDYLVFGYNALVKVVELLLSGRRSPRAAPDTKRPHPGYAGEAMARGIAARRKAEERWPGRRR
jgi:hypothetical protein